VADVLGYPTLAPTRSTCTAMSEPDKHDAFRRSTCRRCYWSR